MSRSFEVWEEELEGVYKYTKLLEELSKISMQKQVKPLPEQNNTCPVCGRSHNVRNKMCCSSVCYRLLREKQKGLKH